MSTGPLIPWVDIYTDLPNGRELRQRNRDRLAELEAQTPERQFRLKVAAEARRAEEACGASLTDDGSGPYCVLSAGHDGWHESAGQT